MVCLTKPTNASFAFPVFCFSLNSPKEFASLYSFGKFAQRRVVLYDTVPNP